MINGKPIGTIYETYDYQDFKFMLGNRNINPASVKKIQESIEKNGFKMCPILINDKDEIVDGQHRYTALKNLGLPIWYVVGEELDVEICKTLNINSKNWTLEDYVFSHASKGMQEYVKLLELQKKLKLNISAAVCLFDAHEPHGQTITSTCIHKTLKISFGLEKIRQIIEFDKFLKERSSIKNWYKNVRQYDSYSFLRFFFHANKVNPKFDLEKFKDIFNRDLSNLEMAFKAMPLIRVFGKKYNTGRSTNSVDFDHAFSEYKKLAPTGYFLDEDAE